MTTSIIGRPTIYSNKLVDEICEQLSLGVSLNAICKQADMPYRATVNRWLNDERYLDFRDKYTQARAQQQDYFADEILDIADDCGHDAVIKYNKAGNPYISEDWQSVNRAKTRIGTRQWLMGKVAPKKYGEKQQIEQTVVIHMKEVGWDTKQNQVKFVENEARPVLPPSQERDG